MSSGPVVPPVPPGSRPELAELEARILAERGRISPLYQVLLNSPALASGWEQLLTAVRHRSSLPGALRELVILRVAVLNGAAYEFDAHAPIALREGLSAAQLQALQDSAAAEPTALFSPAQQQVLQLTDAMTRDVCVPAALMAALREQHGAQGLVDLVATVAAYNMVSRLLVALQVGH